MKERVQKILAARGVASRRHAEELIVAGRVACNGRVCVLGESADPNIDTITLDGKPIPSGAAHVYIMLNKPRGYVTTLSDERGRRNVAQLVADCGIRVYPVGRLDMDSDGLLLLTNDGEFANHFMHPRHEIDKTYCVTVTGFSLEGLEKLKQPVTLDGYRIKKPTVSVQERYSDKPNEAVLLITIHEGRNRQVRRMCAIAGMTVRKLTRISEGELRLGSLKVGQWRYLTDAEIKSIWK